MLVTVFLALVIGYFCYVLLRQRKKVRKIPGPMGLPLFGSALQIKSSLIHKQFFDFATIYGKIFEIQLFNRKTVVLNHIDMVQKAFVRDGQFFNDRPDIYVAKLLGVAGGITLRNMSKEHRFVRKTFIKALHVYGSGLAKFERVVHGELERLLTEIGTSNGLGLDVLKLIKRSLVNVMSLLLIGEGASEDDIDTYSRFTESGQIFANPFINSIILSFPFLRHLPLCKRRICGTNEAISKILRKYFYEVKASISSDGRSGIVQKLLHVQRTVNDGDNLSDDMIKSIVLLDVLTAGITSSLSVIPNIMLCLVQNPEYQLRLQEELDRVIGKNRRPSLSDKKACVFLEAVIMEVLRILVPGPFAVPHICRQDIEFEGFSIKADSQVLANVWFIHHDKSIWGDPWTFRPERFLDNDGNLLPNDHKFMKNWIGFGIGPRRCVGMGLAMNRIFLYISTIFQRYTLVPDPGKCGSCDPRTDDFVFNLAIMPKKFFCIAKERHPLKR